MKVAIGLPTTIPGVERHEIIEWATRAEAAGFSSLGTIDRLVYQNYEPLVALGAAAAVTERIGLITSILILPMRQNAALVAKLPPPVRELVEAFHLPRDRRSVQQLAQEQTGRAAAAVGGVIVATSNALIQPSSGNSLWWAWNMYSPGSKPANEISSMPRCAWHCITVSIVREVGASVVPWS